MPIQFKCPNCQQVLKVPDESAGKRAKCPSCTEIVVIPADDPGSLFEDADDLGRRFETPRSETPPELQSAPDFKQNPFASPASVNPEAERVLGSMTHQTIEFGNVFESAMARYKQQMGMGAVFALIVFGVGMVFNIIGQVVSGVAAVANAPVVFVLVAIVTVCLQLFAQAFQQCLSNRFGLNIARGNSEPLGGIFSFESVLPVAFGYLLFAVVGLAVLAVVAIPVLIGGTIDDQGAPVVVGGIVTAILGLIAVVLFSVFAMRFYLFTFFVIDRKEPVMNALRESTHYMQGNKMTAFGLMLVVSIVGGLFVVVTCLIGAFFFVPFLQTVLATIYLKATGQFQEVGALTVE